MRTLILHGWGGSDFPHWQSHLACEIAKNYGCVSFLPLSDPDMPKLGMWKKELLEEMQSFKPDIVVCHSLANILWFHLCNDGSFFDMPKVQKLYLVAPPRLDCTITELSTFFPLEAPKELHAKEALLITSTDDHYLSVEEAQTLQKALGIEMKVLENAGHINTASGYGMWEWIVKECT